MTRQGYTTSVPGLAVGQRQMITENGETAECQIASVTELAPGVYDVTVESPHAFAAVGNISSILPKGNEEPWAMGPGMRSAGEVSFVANFDSVAPVLPDHINLHIIPSKVPRKTKKALNKRLNGNRLTVKERARVAAVGIHLKNHPVEYEFSDPE